MRTIPHKNTSDNIKQTIGKMEKSSFIVWNRYRKSNLINKWKNNGSEIIDPGKLKKEQTDLIRRKGKKKEMTVRGTVAEKEEGHGLQKDSTGNL